MGKALSALAADAEGLVIAAGVDVVKIPSGSFPVYETPAEYTGPADVVVDFSHISALPALLEYCKKCKLPLVLATTGQNDEQKTQIIEASKEIPVFLSANMSVGVALMKDLVRRAAQVLNGYDIEVIEKHHNQKLDAPSGTALLLADAAAEGAGGKRFVYDRHAVRRKRDPGEIGISSVRGGTIIGEHEVLFAGYNEVITIAHSAQSRELFAAGALRAARFMAGKPAGLYTMDDLVASL
jgi:4-hydroxy-tetrahydrodipicolinate reductase